MHRLRAEGHTLNSIREALLDVGVTVSLSTVRREVARPATQWELDRMQQMRLAPAVPQSPTAVPGMTPSPQPFDANGGKPAGPVDGELGVARCEGMADRGTFGLLSKVLRALRRLGSGRRSP
jgi:hypothetical protein